MMSNATHEFEPILQRLTAVSRRLRLYALLDGLAWLSATLLTCILVTLAIDYTVRLDWGMRLAQLLSLLTAIAAIGWWFILRPLRVPVQLAEVAVLVERKYPQLSSILISAVEFAGPQSHSASHSPAMRASVVHEATAQAGHLCFDAILAQSRARRRAAVACACLAGIAVLGLVARDTMGLWLSRNVLLQSVNWPQRNRLIIENLKDGKFTVPRHEDITISAVIDHGYEPPRQAFVEFENPAGVRGREQMPALAQQEVHFTHAFERLATSLRCRVVGGDAATDWFNIEVVDRPQLKNAVITVVPPKYTEQEAYELRSGQTIAEVLKGSEVRFRFQANKPLARATLVRQDAGREAEIADATTSDGVNFVAATIPPDTSTYAFALLDTLGLSNRSERLMPMRFSIRLEADKPPTVKMRIKDAGDMITRDAILPVEGTFSDQYGLATVGIAFEIARERAASQPTASEPATTPQPSSSGLQQLAAASSRPTTQPTFEPIGGFEPRSKDFARTFDWSASEHALAEGDRLNLNCQATDFDDISGPNVGRSAVVTLRVVSHEELLADLGRREQEHRRDFERLLRQQEELYADMLATSRPAEPDAAREYFPRLARLQRDYAGRLNLLRLQFEQVRNKMRINQLATPAVEARLSHGVIEPMDQLYRTTMPQAAAALESLPFDAAGAALKDARAAQEQVIAEMNRIMAGLLKWEGYQEAVTLLRDVLKMQKDLGEETERKVEEQIIGK